MSADNITFAVDDLCTSQRLRPVRRVAAERLMLLIVVALILIIVHGGPKIVRPQIHGHNSVKS